MPVWHLDLIGSRQSQCGIQAVVVAKTTRRRKPCSDRSRGVGQQLRDADRRTFMFWVAFQDGTTEKALKIWSGTTGSRRADEVGVVFPSK